MARVFRWMIALLTATLLTTAWAQDITGNWQGTLGGSQKLRAIVKISKADDGTLKAVLYSIDQGASGLPADSIAVTGSTVKFAIEGIHGNYVGALSANGNSIAGVWTQNGKPNPLDLVRATKETAWAIDSSPHKAQFVTVDKDVKLEVLDWGGTGRSLIFLAGLGNDAHVFDTLAPKFTAKYHVYGITRRGFGESSKPVPANGNYAADRLGDDVLDVMDTLKIERPVLAGHSIAGEELSSVGSRHPEKVAGLIYLDAGFPYAFYDPAVGDPTLDELDTRNRLNQILSGEVQNQKQFFAELQASIAQLEKDIEKTRKDAEAMPAQPPRQSAPPAIPMAIIAGAQRYTKITVPVLAIFAVPHDMSVNFRNPLLRDNPTAQAAMKASDLARTTAISSSFEAGVPSAHVVRMPNADHYVFKSNEADVSREMNAWLDALPAQ